MDNTHKTIEEKMLTKITSMAILPTLNEDDLQQFSDDSGINCFNLCRKNNIS